MDLRASRARTVQAGDAERRRLERDLHDGAQQRLVVLSLALRLLRSQVDGIRAARVDAAEAELQGALSELHELARGIYPAILAEEGLAAALEALAEGAAVPMTMASLPQERFAAAIEAAAYFLVAEVVKARAITGVTSPRSARTGGCASPSTASAGSTPSWSTWRPSAPSTASSPSRDRVPGASRSAWRSHANRDRRRRDAAA